MSSLMKISSESLLHFTAWMLMFLVVATKLSHQTMDSDTICWPAHLQALPYGDTITAKKEYTLIQY
jgi:hypothetical protein